MDATAIIVMLIVGAVAGWLASMVAGPLGWGLIGYIVIGIVGGVVAVASAKWLLLASILATVGFGCCVEVVKEDGVLKNVVLRLAM